MKVSRIRPTLTFNTTIIAFPSAYPNKQSAAKHDPKVVLFVCLRDDHFDLLLRSIIRTEPQTSGADAVLMLMGIHANHTSRHAHTHRTSTGSPWWSTGHTDATTAATTTGPSHAVHIRTRKWMHQTVIWYAPFHHQCHRVATVTQHLYSRGVLYVFQRHTVHGNDAIVNSV